MKSLTESIMRRNSGSNASYKDMLEPGDLVETVDKTLFMFVDQKGNRNHGVNVPEDSFIDYYSTIPLSQYDDKLKNQAQPDKNILTIYKTYGNAMISRDYNQQDLKELLRDCRDLKDEYGFEVIKVK